MTSAVLAAWTAFVLALARAAFRCGRRQTARRLPAALTAELRDHKLRCLHEPPERVRLELLLLVPRAAPQSRCGAMLARMVRQRSGGSAISRSETIAPRSWRRADSRR